MISFIIPGKPKALKRPRFSQGRTYDPMAKEKKQTWLQIAKYRPKLPLAGDVYIKLIFFMPRPKTHFKSGKSSHVLKSNIPEYHSFRPDIDNLIKYILDIIQGRDGFIIDDSQVCLLQAEKIYSITPKTEVTINAI